MFNVIFKLYIVFCGGPAIICLSITSYLGTIANIVLLLIDDNPFSETIWRSLFSIMFKDELGIFSTSRIKAICSGISQDCPNEIIKQPKPKINNINFFIIFFIFRQQLTY